MKTVLAIGFPLVVLGIFVASNWYVAYRLRTLFQRKRRWPLRIGVAVAFFGSLTAMLVGASSTSAAVGLVNVLGGYGFTFYVFLLLALLVVHAPERKWALPRKWVAGSVLVVVLGITTFGALWANGLRVIETEVALTGLEGEVLVAHVSDVHIGHHRGKERLSQIVAEINRLKPDLVLINGDLVDSNAALEPGVLEPLAKLEAEAFFVNGNHDNYVDTKRAFELIEKHGVRILHNEIVDIQGLYLVGLDYMNPDEDTFDMHPSEDKRTIKGILPTLELADDKPSVLMHHSPVGSEYIAAKGVDLMVSGHTHGGQMFPGSLFAPLIFPFNAGLYQRGELQVFVSQGAGTYGPRIRLGTSNEINLLRLKAR